MPGGFLTQVPTSRTVRAASGHAGPMADAQNSNPPARRRRRAARRAAGPPVAASAREPGDAPAEVPLAGPEPGPAAVGVPLVAPSSEAAGDQAAHPAVPAGESGTSPGAPGGHGSPGDAPTHLPAAGHPGAPNHGGQGRSRDRPAEHTPGRANSSGEPPRRAGRTYRDDAAERSLRSLVTTRSTQVTPSAALRAREVALPSAEDLAQAEAETVIVRRHYVPPTVLAAGRRTDRPVRRQPNAQDE